MRLLRAGCSIVLLLGGWTADGAEAGRLRVLTSILPIHCFTANLVGELADVESFLSAGAEAHDFQFTPRERRLFDRADLIIVNGLKLETWLERPIKQSAGAKTVVEAATEFESQLIRVSHHRDQEKLLSSPDGFNPHVWLDPTLATRMVTNILLALQKVDPVHAAAYATNAEAYVARLHALDEEIRHGLVTLAHREIVTQHDAFPYFARRFGLNIVGVLEQSPEVAPTPRHLAALRKAVEASGVKAIFTEPGHSDKLARQFASDLKLRVASLDTLETGDFRPTAYEDGMRRNLHSLQEALK